MTSKICFSCAEEKPITEYHKHRRRKDGRNDVCKTCAVKRQSLYSRTDGARANRAKYWAEYKEKEEKRDKIQEYHRNYQKNMMGEQKERRDATARKRQSNSPRQALYSILYSASHRRPTENIVTLDELMELFEAQGGMCAVSGLKMNWATRSGNGKQPISMSLDRIDGSRGYERDNLRLVCWQVNLMKNCWSEEQMLTMARAIVKNTDAKSTEPTWQPHIVQSEAA